MIAQRRLEACHLAPYFSNEIPVVDHLLVRPDVGVVSDVLDILSKARVVGKSLTQLFQSSCATLPFRDGIRSCRFFVRVPDANGAIQDWCCDSLAQPIRQAYLCCRVGAQFRSIFENARHEFGGNDVGHVENFAVITSQSLPVSVIEKGSVLLRAVMRPVSTEFQERYIYLLLRASIFDRLAALRDVV